MDNRSMLVVAAGLLIAPALPAQPQAPSGAGGIEFAADLPLIESDGLPCVNVRIGDGPELLFGIDTGNVSNTVDLKVAQAAGISMVAIPPPAPAGLFNGAIPALHLGSVAFLGRHALVMDYAANQMPPTLAGTLAYAAFKDRILQIDYVRHRVRISGVLTAPVKLPGKSDRFSLITFGKEGPPIVVARGFELEGRAVTAQVDTMYTGSLLIYTASIPRLGLASVAGGVKTEFFPLTDGGVTMKVAPARSESFDGIRLGAAEAKVYFPNKGVHEPDGLFDATVGLALFRDTILTFDFHDNTISVARPGA